MTFLPVYMLVCAVCPAKYRNTVLIVFSILYLWYGSPLFVFVMTAAAVFSYVSGAMIGRYRKKNRPQARRLLRITAGIYALVLFIMKFLTPVMKGLHGAGLSFLPVPDITVPLGFTFLVLACISYPADVYYGRCEPERSVPALLSWLFFFPKILCGPFVSKAGMQAHEKKVPEDLYRGLLRFSLGLFKKTVIASRAYILFEQVSSLQATSSLFSAWAGAFAAVLALYFELGGYADMAIGLARMCSVKLPEEFASPLGAAGTADFLKKWNITLQGWFDTYIPMPQKAVLPYIAVILTGLIYRPSLNGLAWGLILALILLVERFIPERIPVIRRVILWIALMASCACLLSPSLTDALHYWAMMFGKVHALANGLTFKYILSNIVLLIAALAAFFRIPPAVLKRIERSEAAWLIPLTVILMLVISIAAAVSGSSMPFIFLRSL